MGGNEKRGRRDDEGEEYGDTLADELRRTMEFAVGEVNSALAGLRKVENYLS